MKSVLEMDRCVHCNVSNPNLRLRQSIQTSHHDKSNPRMWGIYECIRCGGVTTVENGSSYTNIYPTPVVLENSIPGRAREYLQQAIDSLHAPAGSVMLSSSSVDAMFKELGYTEGSLYGRINKAVKDGLITQGMSDWAHVVRLEANEQRHADYDAELPTEEDAKSVIEFVKALSQFLFVLPARVKKGIREAPSKPKTDHLSVPARAK